MFTVSNIDGDKTPYIKGALSKKSDLTSLWASAPISDKKALDSIANLKGKKKFHESLQAYQQKRNQTQIREKVLAKDIMTSPVIYLPEHFTLQQAYELCVNAGFRYYPVLNAGMNLIGVLSDRTFLSYTDPETKVLRPSFQDESVKSYIKSPVVSASLICDIHHLAAMMVEERLGCICIVDKNKLSGIVTRGDLLRCFVHAQSFELFG